MARGARGLAKHVEVVSLSFKLQAYLKHAFWIASG
jgi:hypothetical protein